jgi:hypothetical protein
MAKGAYAPSMSDADETVMGHCPACGDDLSLPVDPQARVREIERLGQWLVENAWRFRDSDRLPYWTGWGEPDGHPPL